MFNGIAFQSGYRRISTLLEEADSWGCKGSLIFMPVIGAVLYAFITAVLFFPSLWNIPVKITEENRQEIYNSVKTMVVFVKAEMLCIFFYISFCMATVRSLSAAFLPLTLILIFGTIAIGVIRIFRIDRKYKGH